MDHTEPASKGADADRLPVDGKIGQHRRPPDRLEHQRAIVRRQREDTEIWDDSGALRLGSKEVPRLALACVRRKLGRYPLQHSGHRRG